MSRFLKHLVVVAVLLGVSSIQGRAGEEQPASVDSPPAFESLSLVLLMRGPQADSIPEDRLQQIQKDHRGHLKKMHASGILLIAGPFGDQQDESFRGLCLYRVPVEEARRLAGSDPAVKAGRLRVEVMSWWFKGGSLRFPNALPPAEE